MRVLAAAVAFAAAALYVGVARPLRLRAGAAADGYRVAREQRRDKRAELVERERRDATMRQAMAAISSSPRPGGEGVLQVRRTIVLALDGTQVRTARLSVRPARIPTAEAVHVSASGPVASILALTAQLAEPQKGVVLDTVRLTREAGGLALDLEALGFPGSGR